MSSLSIVTTWQCQDQVNLRITSDLESLHISTRVKSSQSTFRGDLSQVKSLFKSNLILKYGMVECHYTLLAAGFISQNRASNMKPRVVETNCCCDTVNTPPFYTSVRYNLGPLLLTNTYVYAIFVLIKSCEGGWYK